MDNILKNKKIVLGITASIAAYKAPLIVREFIKLGAEVKVIMTPSAVEFVSPMILSNLSLNPVVIEMFEKATSTQGAWHIHLAHWCDLMMLAPCSASTMGKIAHGISDNALTAVTLALHDEALLLVAPAMDTNMWLHPATQRNLKQIDDDGAVIIPPAEGELASGLVGPGRLPEISVLIDYARQAFTNKNIIIEKKKKANDIKVEFTYKRFDSKIEEIYQGKNIKENKSNEIIINSLQDSVEKVQFNTELDLTKLKQKMGLSSSSFAYLKGKRLLINAGPTYEKIDDVRFIGNFSSGKMGYSIAKNAQLLGANVTLISGPVSIPAPAGVKIVKVISAIEMYDAVMKELNNCDIIILAAAVSDFSPKEKVNGKIKKESAQDNITLELVKTKDILFEIGKIKKPEQILIGFALESENEIENGFKKMQNKNCDIVIVNSANKPDSGFSGDNNTITVLTQDGKHKEFPPMSKDLCSIEILKAVGLLLAK
jgi:phosphopantothenoylcysteine decarboxylase / phosphopantothenate---cysteine ligase